MFEDRYSFGTRVAAPFDDVREAVEAALRGEGFGVLTEIDVAATMRAKLGVELDPYLILGACNPPLAHRAIMADPSVGTLLPCNVVIRVDGDEVVLEAMDPRAALGLVGRDEVTAVAEDARARLRRAVDRVAEQLPVPA
ncbi:MAG TPA: DUF302 domain-containing protein [Candidatus Limnocylindrales bacterium]|nr:DUF302 domain-containing protein [Candidatus Limnocylindrales bacterium]